MRILMDRYSKLLPVPDQRALYRKRWAPTPEHTVDFRTFPDGTITLESSFVRSSRPPKSVVGSFRAASWEKLRTISEKLRSRGHKFVVG